MAAAGRLELAQCPYWQIGGLGDVMRVQGAVIREQGQTFAVVIVKPHARWERYDIY